MPLTARNQRSSALLDRMIRRSQRTARDKGKANVGRDAVSAPAHRLSYYASTLPDKENWHQTPEGYRIYTNVPICRTGSQTYLGRELKKNEGYRPEWGIGDDEVVEVHRPLEEVTARETLASFEGKSVLDAHPPDPKILIDAMDEYEGISKGHGSHIRVGDPLAEGEFAGETPLIGDLTVKHPDLNVKIDDVSAGGQGIRDVSCGYTFTLDREDSGRYVMRNIRGNHIAVVPKGRAGPEIGIRDSAPPETTTEPSTQKGFSMNLLEIVGRGFKSWAADAKPEEIGGALEALREGDAVKDSASVVDTTSPAFVAAVNAAVDAKMAAKDAEEKEKEDEEKAAKDAEKECESMADESMEEEEEAAKDDAEVIPSMSESIFSVGDAAKHLGNLRTVVARSKDKGVIDSYNKLAKSLKTLRTGVKDSAIDPFKALVTPSNSAVADAAEEPSMWSFFNGKPYDQGIKDWNEYQKSKGAR